MADREKVINALEICAEGFSCPKDCPYWMECNDLEKPMFVELAKDALSLLKDQEAVEPILGVGECPCETWFVCPVCKISVMQFDNYCSHCGRMLKWNERKDGDQDG